MKIAVVLIALVVARTSAADELHLEVNGDACDLTGLRDDVAAISTSSPSVRVRVELTDAASGLSARVSFPDRDHGSRSVTAASCSELIDSIALVIAMALAAPDVSPVSEPAIEAAQPMPVIATETALIDRGPAPVTTPTSFDVYLGGGSGLSSNGARGLAVVGTRARRGAFSLALQLRADAPEHEPVTSTGSVSIVRSELSLAPCLHRGALAGCLAAGVGVIRGEGVGLRAAQTGYSPTAATALRLTWEQPIHRRIAIRAALEARVLLTTTQFEVDFMRVWRSERVEGSGGVGLIARFL